MTVKHTKVYKIDVYGSGSTYEETSQRAYAWEIINQLRKLGRADPSFSDALMVIKNCELFIDILNEYKTIKDSERTVNDGKL